MPGQEPPRVAVTGLGVVSSIALGASEFVTALREGRCGAAPISLFDTAGFAHSNGHQVPEFDRSAWLERLDPASWGRAAVFAATAARMAVADARLPDSALRAGRGLVSVGTTDGGSHEMDQVVAQEIAAGPDSTDRHLVGQIPAGALSMAVARELGLTRVEASTLATACSAGNYAIGDGLDALRAGDVDFALCGGADALCRRNFTGFYRLGLLAPDRCRPFDAERRGLLTGEGAGVLLLEEMGAARARGARIYAEVLGYATTCDAHHQLTPHQPSIERCMRLALDDAGVKPDEVDLISAHGTGTRTNDAAECGAIAEVFDAAPPPTVGLKAMLGHTMGAASALAGIASVLALDHGFVPPTVNHRETDPECPVDCVPNTARDADLRVVQNNGFAFAGNNAIVLFGRPGPPPGGDA